MTDHFLTRAKAYAALLGSVLTAVLGTVPPHTRLWTALTLAAAVATGVATYAVPNAKAGDEDGNGDAGTLLLVAVVIGVALLLFGVRFR